MSLDKFCSHKKKHSRIIGAFPSTNRDLATFLSSNKELFKKLLEKNVSHPKSNPQKLGPCNSKFSTNKTRKPWKNVFSSRKTFFYDVFFYFT